MKIQHVFTVILIFGTFNLFMGLLLFEEFAHSDEVEDDTKIPTPPHEPHKDAVVDSHNDVCLPDMSNTDALAINLNNDPGEVIHLVPKPKRVKTVPRIKPFRLSVKTVMDVDKAVPSNVLTLLQHVLWCEAGLHLSKVSGGSEHETSIALSYSSLLEEEEYELSVYVSTLSIVTKTPAGLMNAWTTIKQLMPHYSYSSVFTQQALLHFGFIPVTGGVEIRDLPAYSYRGLLVDSARHFVSMPNMYRILRHMVQYKLNVLHWHLTDDQGWRIESTKFPQLHLIGGKRGAAQNPSTVLRYQHSADYPDPMFYSQEEIRRFVEVASFHNVEVVPEIDLPAHSAALINGARLHGFDIGVVDLHEGCTYAPGDDGSERRSTICLLRRLKAG
eukprot:PhF_6_TR26395/c0_g1_i3/m.38117/K12373/HEXA_B; hexosaminidase